MHRALTAVDSRRGRGRMAAKMRSARRGRLRYLVCRGASVLCQIRDGQRPRMHGRHVDTARRERCRFGGLLE